MKIPTGDEAVMPKLGQKNAQQSWDAAEGGINKYLGMKNHKFPSKDDRRKYIADVYAGTRAVLVDGAPTPVVTPDAPVSVDGGVVAALAVYRPAPKTPAPATTTTTVPPVVPPA